MEFLYLLGNSDELKENSQKYQKTKKPKNVHVAGALKQTVPELCEEKDLMKPCLEYQGLLKNVSNISSLMARKKNKKFKNKHCGDGSEDLDPAYSTQCSGENQAFSCSSASEIGKKTKKDKGRRKVCPEQPSDAASRSVCRSPQAPRKSPGDQPRPRGSSVGRLPSPEFGEGNAGPAGGGGSSQTLYQHGGFESVLDQLAGGTMTGFKKPWKPHKEASVHGVSGIPSPETDSCRSDTDLLLSSAPTGPEFHSDGSGDELSVRGPKAKRLSRRRKSRTEETPDRPDLSQEVFVVQESFVPGPVPRSLDLSQYFPSLPSSRASCGRQCDRSIPSREVSRERPPLPSNDEEAQKLEGLFLNHFKTRKKKKSQVATQEKASQTENFFSSPALSTFLLFRQRKQEAEEKPLDLRVPGRRESLSAGSAGASPGPRETTCLLEDEPPGSEILLVGESRKDTCRQARPRRAGKRRYVQTLLNSSFYFKMKGEPGTNVSKEPLVKSKVKIKAKSSSK
ncbi:uncharacterized protein LOC114810200 [Ornithorhynchus anatinus]|uniref:uncharacterized protein LOC114810200 n=1 Tax=Ornithorhynchus anatinus TaxID=9258 RepID=UPI0010A753E1|nr:uncharacterized protein LOC114810200 [Ornithorhynchus anatinus]